MMLICLLQESIFQMLRSICPTKIKIMVYAKCYFPHVMHNRVINFLLYVEKMNSKPNNTPVKLFFYLLQFNWKAAYAHCNWKIR